MAQIYEQLWQESAAAFEAGQPQIDRHLSDPAKDRRRGVSLIFHPSPSVQTSIKCFQDTLAAVCPGQYFYRPEEFHVTALTLISGGELWRGEMRDVAAFRAILREVLSRHHSFEVEFRGVTAAPSAVMIQGFPRDGGLEGIRDDLRRAFAQRGFANRLDRRYRSATAHITAMRFAQPEADWQRLLTVLRANRQTPFGMMAVDQLQLVWGDWYGTIGNLRVLEEFPLAKRA